MVMLSTIPLASTTTTSVSIADLEVESGSTTAAPVLISSATNLGGCDLSLTYNSSIVRVADVTPGNMELLRYRIDNEAGWMRVNAINVSGQDGDAIPAYLNLTVVGDGICVSQLNITDIMLLGTDYNEISCTVRSGSLTVKPPSGMIKVGDVNGDGMVDMHDAMYLANHLLGTPGFEEINEEVVDVDGDGMVDIHDAMYLAKHVIGMSGFEELGR
jgi:hypothetical protein